MKKSIIFLSSLAIVGLPLISTDILADGKLTIIRDEGVWAPLMYKINGGKFTRIKTKVEHNNIASNAKIEIMFNGANLYNHLDKKNWLTFTMPTDTANYTIICTYYSVLKHGLTKEEDVGEKVCRSSTGEKKVAGH